MPFMSLPQPHLSPARSWIAHEYYPTLVFVLMSLPGFIDAPEFFTPPKVVREGGKIIEAVYNGQRQCIPRWLNDHL